jgi:hypothetical protein
MDFSDQSPLLHSRLRQMYQDAIPAYEGGDLLSFGGAKRKKRGTSSVMKAHKVKTLAGLKRLCASLKTRKSKKTRKGSSGRSAWIRHVKKVAREEGLPYKEALSVASESWGGQQYAGQLSAGAKYGDFDDDMEGSAFVGGAKRRKKRKTGTSTKALEKLLEGTRDIDRYYDQPDLAIQEYKREKEFREALAGLKKMGTLEEMKEKRTKEAKKEREAKQKKIINAFNRWEKKAERENKKQETKDKLEELEGILRVQGRDALIRRAQELEQGYDYSEFPRPPEPEPEPEVKELKAEGFYGSGPYDGLLGTGRKRKRTSKTTTLTRLRKLIASCARKAKPKKTKKGRITLPGLLKSIRACANRKHYAKKKRRI